MTFTCRIGAQAFQHCSKLNRIVCEKKFLHRQEEAFHSSEVQAVYVGNKAFDGAPLLNKLFDEFYISHNILMEYLGNKTDVVIPEGVEEIGVMAFENCALSSVTFPESLKRINVCAFRGNHLHQLILPEKVESVDQWAFNDNPALELVTLKSRKIRIQPNAFSGTPVEPYAMPVDGRWGSLWEPEIKEDPSVVPYRRVELPPTPNNLIGVTTLNVQRTLRGFLMDGNILIQFFPNWKETGRAPLKIYQASNICSFVDRKFTVQHLPEEIKKVLPTKYQLPIRRVHSTISTAGLCRTRRENMPVWYAISYKDI